jgi:HK97 family phage portal protein
LAVAAVRNLDPTDQLQLAAMLRLGGLPVGSIRVDETSAMGISAFFRGVSLISGQLASLPLRTYTEGRPDPLPSIFDNPDSDEGQTPYEWKESLFLHQLLHGKAGALKMRNAAGGIYRLPLVHPLSFRERVPTEAEVKRGDRMPRGGLWFDLTLADGRSVTYDADDFLYLPGLSLDGKTGVSLLTYARRSLGTTIAADESAGRLFTSGAMMAGIATPDDDEDIQEDVPQIKREIEAATAGPENAGGIAVIARRLKITPWSMTASDAQFLQSRQFQIEEVARWLGVPPHLLMQTEKQTSWGTGVEMQDRALGRTVLGTWAQRFEERASRLLARPRRVEFDFTRLERPSPDREIELDLQQVAAGVMTIDEYRARRGWAPLPKAERQPDPAPDDDPEGGDDDPTAE